MQGGAGPALARGAWRLEAPGPAGGPHRLCLLVETPLGKIHGRFEADLSGQAARYAAQAKGLAASLARNAPGAQTSAPRTGWEDELEMDDRGDRFVPALASMAHYDDRPTVFRDRVLVLFAALPPEAKARAAAAVSHPVRTLATEIGARVADGAQALKKRVQAAPPHLRSAAKIVSRAQLGDLPSRALIAGVHQAATSDGPQTKAAQKTAGAIAEADRYLFGDRRRTSTGGIDPSLVPDVPPEAAQTIQAAYGEASAEVQSQINQVLGQAGFSSSDVQKAVDAYNTLGPSAVQAVSDLSQGNALGALAAATPLIAAGLAATGVGAPVAGAIMAGLTIFEGIASSLHLTSKSPPLSCHWTVIMAPFGQNQSALCFNGPRPYGHNDPNWLSMEAFAAGPDKPRTSPISWQLMDAHTQEALPANQQPGAPGVSNESWPGFAFGPWWQLLERDLYALGVQIPGQEIQAGSLLAGTVFDTLLDPACYAGQVVKVALPFPPGAFVVKTPDALKGFIVALEQAIIRSLEYPINGWSTPAPLAILEAAAAAWNAAHGADVTYTFKGSGQTYVDALIRGDHNGQSWTPVTINLGAALAPQARAGSPALFHPLTPGPQQTPCEVLAYAQAHPNPYLPMQHLQAACDAYLAAHPTPSAQVSTVPAPPPPPPPPPPREPPPMVPPPSSSSSGSIVLPLMGAGLGLGLLLALRH